MGKSFKRLLAERRRQHKQLPAKIEILEQIIETKPEPKVVPNIQVPKVEVVEIVEQDDDEEVQVSTEELAKSVLQSQQKKGALKKK